MRTQGSSIRAAAGWLDSWQADMAIAAVLALAAVPHLGAEPGARSPLGLLLVALPLAVRRQALAGLALQLVGAALIGPVYQSPPPVLIALAVGAYRAAGVGGRRPRILTAAGASATAFVIHFSTERASGFLLVSIWLSAAAVRALWQRSVAAEQRTQALRNEQEALVGEQEALRTLAISEERTRIARELHDVLGHTVSVMIIMAGAARQALPPAPEGADSVAHSALYEVEVSGRQAMGELRNLLQLLSTGVSAEDETKDETKDEDEGDAGDAGDAGDFRPQPGLEQLDLLLERVRAAGLPVELIRRGEERALEPGLDLTAFRIVQEGLTNALKYSGGAPTEVIVEYERDMLSLQVRDHGSTPGQHGPELTGGRGLLGLHERVAIYGGELVATRAHDGGFSLSARLPIEAR